MALQTLTIPTGGYFSTGTSEEHAPRVLRNDFGDGYSQRSGDGLNADLGKLHFRFNVASWAEAQVLLDFFAAHRGYLPFLFRLPNAAAAQTWIATSWTRTWANQTRVDVAADFEEVADPS